MKILITGSRGFIGGSVGRFAARAGHEVLGVGRAARAQGDWPGAYVRADAATSDLSGLIREFAPDVILHAAGTASVGASFAAPLDDLRAAALTWANTLEGVRQSGLKPLIVFPSSAAVYGDANGARLNEETATRPISPYGFHKAACELLACEYAECFGQRVLICRLFSLFGARQRRLLVWELYRQCVDSAAIVWLQGTGEEVRDYLHIEDMTAALFHLVESRLRVASEGDCLTVNVASGEETCVRDLAERLRDLAAPGKEIRCRNLPRPGDPTRWRADVSRLRSLTNGWQPRPLTQSLAQCISDWSRDGEKQKAVGSRQKAESRRQ